MNVSISGLEIRQTTATAITIAAMLISYNYSIVPNWIYNISISLHILSVTLIIVLSIDTYLKNFESFNTDLLDKDYKSQKIMIVMMMLTAVATGSYIFLISIIIMSVMLLTKFQEFRRLHEDQEK